MSGVASRNLYVQTKEKSGIIILIALAMGFIMATLDVTVVNVAVVNIQETLGLTLYSSTWIVDGYILSFAALLLAGGALANRFGAKRIYLIGLIIFVFASLFMYGCYNGERSCYRADNSRCWSGFIYAKFT